MHLTQVNTTQNLLKNLLKKHGLGVLVVVVALVLSSYALLVPSLFRIHDYTHAARIVEMYTSMKAGDFPVRWTGNFGFGYGMPLFEFYAPLPYYVGASVFWLTNNIILATKSLFFLANLTAAVASYGLGLVLFRSKKSAALLALTFTLAPYRAVNLYVRGAVSEAWGASAMMIVLWGGFAFLAYLPASASKNTMLLRLQQQLQLPYYWLLIAGLLTLALSHNLSTLMFMPLSFLLFLGLTFFRKEAWQCRLTTICSICLAYLISSGLASFYLFPALLENKFTIINSILSGYFFYAHHFLYIRQFFNSSWGYGGSAWGPDDGMSFFLGWPQLLGLLLLLLELGIVVIQRCLAKIGLKSVSFATKLTSRSNQYQIYSSLILLGVTLGGLYLTLLKAEWLWRLSPVLPFIQFPWRWLSVVGVVLAISVAYLYQKYFDGSKWANLVLMVLVIGSLCHVSFFRPESYLDDSESLYYTDAKRIRTEMSSVLPDYIPASLQLQPLLSKSADQAELNGLPVNLEKQVVLEPETYTQSKTLLGEPQQKLLQLESSNARIVTLGVAAYPGWAIEVDGLPVSVHQSQHGLLQFNLPEGQHVVGVYLGSTTVRWWSDSISIITLLLVLVLLVQVGRSDTRIKNESYAKK